MENAGVPEKDAYNVKVERDRENDIPIFQVEFETEYGNYDFEIAITGGKIIGVDYEVDEEWLDRLGGSPVTLEKAKQAVQSKVPASSTENIRMWEESGDGPGPLWRGSCSTTASNMSLRLIQRPGLFLTGMRICGNNRPAQSWFEQRKATGGVAADDFTVSPVPEQITKAESRILDYISNNPEEFLLSSIGEVGEKLDVSGTTFPALCAVWAVGIIRS